MRSFLVAFFIGISLSCFSQNDALQTEMKQLEEQLKVVHGSRKVEVFNRLAELYLNVYNLRSIEYAKMALDSIRRYKLTVDNLIKANLYSTLGAAYYNIKEYKSSAEYFDKEYELIKDSENNENVFLSLYNLGAIYNKLNSNKKSVKYFLRSLSLAEKSNSGELLLQNYLALHEVYQGLGDAENSLKYYKLYNALKDSLVITEARKEITILKSKYKKAIQEKKIKEVELVKKQKTLDITTKQKQDLELDSARKAQEILYLNEVNRAKELDLQVKELKIAEEEQKVQAQKRIIYFLIILFIVISVFSVLLYWQFKLKKSAYKQIQLDKSIIEKKIEENKIKNIKIEYQNKELIELNSMKDKFFSIIAHDLRNPFNHIIGFTDLLLDNIEKYEKEKVKEILVEISKSSKLAYKLLENLLEWSMSQSGKLEFNPVDLNLMEIINESIINLHNLASQKGIEIIHEVHPGMVVHADKNMVNTILRNLLTNAVKFTNSGGIIRITATRNGNITEISVIDNGIGIEPEMVSKLFNIEDGFSTPGTDKERGSGLGLILCQEFVQRNGGKIWVESNPGVGSKFTFTLPSY